MTNEPFFSDLSQVSYLKLRLSWGVTGNTPMDHFPALGLFEGGRYGGLPGIIQSQIPNPNLRWEETVQTDIGIDFGLFDDRLSGKLDYYFKDTKNLLLNVNIPATIGFDSQLQNLGRLQNSGFEVAITSYNLTRKLKWKTRLNWSRNVNRVTDLNGQTIAASVRFASISRVMENEALGIFYAPEFAGVDAQNGDPLFYLNNIIEDGSVDRTTTNDISQASRAVIGDPHPEFWQPQSQCL